MMTGKMHIHTYMKILIFNSKGSTASWSPPVNTQGSMDLKVRMIKKQEWDNWQTLVERLQQRPTPVMAKNSTKAKAMKRERERTEKSWHNLQELVISWMWVSREEHQGWRPDGWLKWWSSARISWGKWWTGEKSQWDIQNWVCRAMSGRRRRAVNQKSESQAEQAIAQGRVTGPTRNSRGYMRHLDVAGLRGYEPGQRPHKGKPGLNVKSTGQKVWSWQGLGFRVRTPPQYHFINRNTNVLICACGLSAWPHQCDLL